MGLIHGQTHQEQIEELEGKVSELEANATLMSRQGGKNLDRIDTLEAEVEILKTDKAMHRGLAARADLELSSLLGWIYWSSEQQRWYIDEERVVLGTCQLHHQHPKRAVARRLQEIR